MTTAEGGNKRLILNNRPLLLIVSSLFCGIFAAALLIEFFAFFITAIAVLAIAVIVMLCTKKRRIALVIIAILVGMSTYFISDCVNNVSAATYEDAIVKAQVSDATAAKNGYKYGYIIKNIAINASDVRGKGAVYSNDILSVGDVVIIEGTCISAPFDPFDSRSMHKFRAKISHTIDGNNITIIGKERLSFGEAIRVKIRELYINTMGEKAGGFGLALMIGDKSILSNEITDNFKVSGITHILALSGLHIAFMLGIIIFILRKLHIKKWVIYFVAIMALAAYGVLAGAPASMVRAIIMLVIMAVAEVSYMRYDAINALALTAIIICVFAPLSLFELGFQMSFTAVLGITLFYKPIKNVIYKPKIKNYYKPIGRLHKFVASSVSLSLSANSLLIAILFNTFSAFGIYFCISNLIVVPLISFTYSLLVPLSVACLIVPQLGVLMLLTKYLLLASCDISSIIASMPYASVPIVGVGIIGIGYVAILIFMSRLVMLESKYKFRVLAVAAPIIILAQYLIISL